MITIEPHPEGVVLHVRAQSGARGNGLRGEQDGSLKVSVTQAPERGKANKAILELLARQLGLRKSQILLISGQTAPHKRFLLQGVTADELRHRLAAKLA